MGYAYDSGSVTTADPATSVDDLLDLLSAFLTGSPDPGWTLLSDASVDSQREGNLGASRELWFTAPSTTSSPYHVGMRVAHPSLTAGAANVRFNVIADSGDPLGPPTVFDGSVPFEEQGPGGGWIPNDGATTLGFPRLILPAGAENLDYEFAADADHCRILVRRSGLTAQLAYLGAMNPVGPDVDDASHWPWPVFCGASAWQETTIATGDDFHWPLPAPANDTGADYANSYLYRGQALRLAPMNASRVNAGAPGKFWTTWARATAASKVGLTPAGRVFTMEAHAIESISAKDERLLGSFRGLRYLPHLVDGGFLADNTVLGTGPDPVYVVIQNFAVNSSDKGASMVAFLRTE